MLIIAIKCKSLTIWTPLLCMTGSTLVQVFMYIYGTPKKMSAAFPILKLNTFNISIL